MTKQLEIDFMYLDLTTCTRCRGTNANLELALETADELLQRAGIEASLSTIHVQTPEQARSLQFVSSPTIRVNGRDIALELRESSCGSEACTDGCGDSIACRVWVHRGREYTEPPVEMIVDAILRQAYGGTAQARPGADAPYELPENLARFFAGKAAAAAEDVEPSSSCCSGSEQETCCDASDKGECCGTVAVETCGCR